MPAHLLPEPLPVLAPLLGCVHVGRRLVVWRGQHRYDADHDALHLGAGVGRAGPQRKGQGAARLRAVHGMVVSAPGQGNSWQLRAQGVCSTCCTGAGTAPQTDTPPHRVHGRPALRRSLVAVRVIARAVEDGDAYPPIVKDCGKDGGTRGAEGASTECASLRSPWVPRVSSRAAGAPAPPPNPQHTHRWGATSQM